MAVHFARDKVLGRRTGNFPSNSQVNKTACFAANMFFRNVLILLALAHTPNSLFCVLSCAKLRYQRGEPGKESHRYELVLMQIRSCHVLPCPACHTESTQVLLPESGRHVSRVTRCVLRSSLHTTTVRSQSRSRPPRPWRVRGRYGPRRPGDSGTLGQWPVSPPPPTHPRRWDQLNRYQWPPPLTRKGVLHTAQGHGAFCLKCQVDSGKSRQKTPGTSKLNHWKLESNMSWTNDFKAWESSKKTSRNIQKIHQVWNFSIFGPPARPDLRAAAVATVARPKARPRPLGAPAASVRASCHATAMVGARARWHESKGHGGHGRKNLKVWCCLIYLDLSWFILIYLAFLVCLKMSRHCSLFGKWSCIWTSTLMYCIVLHLQTLSAFECSVHQVKVLSNALPSDAHQNMLDPPGRPTGTPARSQQVRYDKHDWHDLVICFQWLCSFHDLSWSFMLSMLLRSFEQPIPHLFTLGEDCVCAESARALRAPGEPCQSNEPTGTCTILYTFIGLVEGKICTGNHGFLPWNMGVSGFNVPLDQSNDIWIWRYVIICLCLTWLILASWPSSGNVTAHSTKWIAKEHALGVHTLVFEFCPRCLWRRKF